MPYVTGSQITAAASLERGRADKVSHSVFYFIFAIADLPTSDLVGEVNFFPSLLASAIDSYLLCTTAASCPSITVHNCKQILLTPLI